MNALEHIRKNILKLSQAGMAELVGANQATISRWEKGELQPSLAQMNAIREKAKADNIWWDDRWFFEAPPSPDAEKLRAAP